MFAVTDLDHVVLRVADIEASLAWYCERLGLEGVRIDEWRSAAAPFPSVRISATAIIDLVAGGSTRADVGGRVASGTPGDRVGVADGANLDHLCLVVAPCDLVAEATAVAIEVEEGPVHRFGARGWGTSIYVRDPDGNVVELRHYG